MHRFFKLFLHPIITLIKSGITLLAVYMQIPITKEHMETSAKEQGLSYAMISGHT